MRTVRLLPSLLVAGCSIGAVVLLRPAAGLLTGRAALAQNPAVALRRGAVDPIKQLPAPPGVSGPPAAPRLSGAKPPALPVASATGHAADAASAIEAPTEAQGDSRQMRVGLSTAGGPLRLWSAGSLDLTDPTQPGRRLQLPQGGEIQFEFGAVGTVAVNTLAGGPVKAPAAGAKTWSGPITLQTSAGKSAAWGAVQVTVDAGPARLSSNGTDPRYGRPYRGDFEIWPQRSPEPNHRKGELTVINILPLEQYLMGVVPWEMGPAAPIEALKAQAICARTKAIQFAQSGKFAAGGFDICDYDACQGYPGTENEKPITSEAVAATAGLALFYKGKAIDAVYSTNSGGITANASDVWKQNSPIPYLRSVNDLEGAGPQPPAPAGTGAENYWRQFCTRAWPSFACPSASAREALAARRAKSVGAAKLYGPDDWPEFYRWQRSISVAEMSAAIGASPGTLVSELDVVERTASGRVRKLVARGFAPQLARGPKDHRYGGARLASRQATAARGASSKWHLTAGGMPPGGTVTRTAPPDSGSLGGPVEPGAPLPGTVLSPPNQNVPSATPRSGPEAAPIQQPVDLAAWEGDAAIRSLISKKLGSTTALPSSLFSVDVQIDPAGKLKGWELHGAGWGHGVGLCQRGAQNHALDGWDARRILNWYYRDVKIETLRP